MKNSSSLIIVANHSGPSSFLQQEVETRGLDYQSMPTAEAIFQLICFAPVYGQVPRGIQSTFFV